MRLVLVTSLVTLSLVASALAQESAYVTGDRVNERLCPSAECPSTNRVHRGQRVDIFERQGGWARVTEYYDSAAERAEFPTIRDAKVARWIAVQFLASTPPAPLEQPDLDETLLDHRIQGMPDVGDYGLTEADVVTLRRYSLHLLNSGECSGIEYGDKSVSRPNTYYVVCVGEVSNRFFSSDEVP